MHLLSCLLLVCIRLYRVMASPLLPVACRFAPTCSDYATQAINRHGTIQGFWLALRRVLRCHPWGKTGYDPVPEAQHDGQ